MAPEKFGILVDKFLNPSQVIHLYTPANFEPSVRQRPILELALNF